MPSAFLKDSLHLFKAYIPGKQPEIRKENSKLFAKLNTNENPFSPPKACANVLSHFSKNSHALRLYPDPQQTKLRLAASSWLNSKAAHSIYKIKTTPEINFNKDHFVFGNGSDELISAIFRTFYNSGEKVALPNPTYGAYEVYANSYAAKCIFYNAEKDLSFALKNKKIFQQAKIVFFTNPAAPTGIFTSTDELATCIKNNPQTLFVIDEAYIDFTNKGSMAAYICPPQPLLNLIILRTFSKTPSLAGIRLGFAIANQQLIAELRMMLDPYNVNMLSQALGKAALENYNEIISVAKLITALKKKLQTQLTKLGFSICRSEANFLFAKFPKQNAVQKTNNKNASELHKYLQSHNIYLRYFKAFPQHLRITIGSQTENDYLLQIIHTFLSK